MKRKMLVVEVCVCVLLVVGRESERGRREYLQAAPSWVKVVVNEW